MKLSWDQIRTLIQTHLLNGSYNAPLCMASFLNMLAMSTLETTQITLAAT